MKFIPPLGRIQQVGAPETAAKSVALCFTFGYGLQGLRHKFVCHNRQHPHGTTSAKGQPRYEFLNAVYTTLINHEQSANHTALIRFD